MNNLIFIITITYVANINDAIIYGPFLFLNLMNSQGRSGLPCEFDADLW